MSVRVERAYAGKGGREGTRYLVDRIWPRGVTRAALHVDAWLREVAPSDRLRRWFAHDPERWPEFERRYFEELDAKPEAWAPLAAAARKGTVTLVFGAKDEAHNNAVALRDYLHEKKETDVDEVLAESFPASDPPSWTSMHIGGPKHAR